MQFITKGLEILRAQKLAVNIDEIVNFTIILQAALMPIFFA